MLLLVGLGNPGTNYAGTRHNIGFQALNHIAMQNSAPAWRKRFDGLYSQCRIKTETASLVLTLLKPLTFYNESGRSVRRATDFWKLEPEQIIVLHDDIDLAPGRIRIKQSGGHSGNNGMRSVIEHVSAEVRRIRIGIGRPEDRQAVSRYVLSDFSSSEQIWRNETLKAVNTALPLLISGKDERFQCEVMRLAPAPKTATTRDV